MAFENGINWKPIAPHERGRHATFASAVQAAFNDLLTVHDEFFDSLVDRWKELFPALPAIPGRFEDGKIFLYVKNAPTNFAIRARLPAIRKLLLQLPGAPKRIDLRVEIHS